MKIVKKHIGLSVAMSSNQLYIDMYIHEPHQLQVAFHFASPHLVLLTAAVAFTNAFNSHAPVVLSKAEAGHKGERLNGAPPRSMRTRV